MRSVLAFFLFIPFFIFSENFPMANAVGEPHYLVGQSLLNNEWIVWLDNESYWLIKPLKKRDRTWVEWLASEEPLENNWNEEFYFPSGSWTQGSFIQVYNSCSSYYKDYPYILMNIQTGHLAFAKLVCLSKLRLPKLEVAKAFFDYPISDSLSIVRNLYKEIQVIVLEDGPWYLFEVDKVNASWNEWWNKISPEQPDPEFFSSYSDWLILDSIQVYFRNFALTKASDEYGVKQDFGTAYLIENKRTGKLSYALPIENKDFIDRLLDFADSQYNLGVTNGYTSGYSGGYTSGYSEGYSLGYSDGQKSE